MKNLKRLGTLAAVLALASVAVAGDCSSSGFDCANMCPLAKQAGERRSFGAEGGSAAQKALAAQVAKNLARV
ncbi:MAG TPA: hypothetical protein VFS92_01290 [Planctomycetota bacterium]|nr:hypothetical protein [Planctomycetota bacterium]